MNAKQKDKALTAIVVILVACLMAAMVWMMWAYGNGDILEDTMMLLASTLAGGMFFVVILYAVIGQKTLDDAKRYKQFLEDNHLDEEDEKR